jgi:hypothetical protein
LFILLVLALSASSPLIAWASPNAGPACTTIGGDITTTRTLSIDLSPYCVRSKLNVGRAAALVIQPSVVLAFYPGTSLQVDGELVARGTPEKPIVFTSANPTPAAGDWDGIYLTPNSRGATYDRSGNYVSGSVIQGARVLYVGGAAVQTTNVRGAILASTSLPYVDHVLVQHGLYDGIDLVGGHLTWLTNNRVEDTGIALIGGSSGINVFGMTAPGDFETVTGNVAIGNKGAGIKVFAQAGATATVTNNVADSNDGSGFYLAATGGFVKASGNTATHNGSSGIYSFLALLPEGSLDIIGNVVAENTGDNGGGIYVSCQTCQTGGARIEGNTLSRNQAKYSGGGIYLDGYGGPTTEVGILGNTIAGNQADRGGGIGFFGMIGQLDIAQNVIVSNRATTTGGGIDLCNGCFPALHHNDLFGNTAGLNGTVAPSDVTDENVSGTTVDAILNWWGTTNSAAIQQHIWDHQDNGSLGIVSVSPFLFGALPLPDLTSGAVTDFPSSVDQGHTITLAYDVVNSGPGDASASTLGFYLSTTPQLADEAIKLVGSPAAANLAAGTNVTATSTELVPLTTPSGAYFVISCANDTKAVVETTSSNNCTASATTIQIGSVGTT